jgi:hypothetical protein
MGGPWGEISREMALATYRAVGRERDAAHDQPAREHKKLTSEAGMPQLPDPSVAWDDLSSDDRKALTELLVKEIVIKRLPVRQTRTAVAAIPSAQSRTKIPRSKPSG